LKELIKKMPGQDYIYLGDTAHVPYGNRSADVISKLTEQAVDFLFQQGAERVVVGCNTASAKALSMLENKYPEKIIGVIDPVTDYFSKSSYNSIGVIGTRATIGSDMYSRDINKMTPDKQVYSLATPLLVPLVEENFLSRPETESILRGYLDVLKLKKVDALILGCTHYPMMLDLIKKSMGVDCHVPNPAVIVAEAVATSWSLGSAGKLEGSRRYMVTDLTDNVQEIANRFLGHDINLEKVTL